MYYVISITQRCVRRHILSSKENPSLNIAKRWMPWYRKDYPQPERTAPAGLDTGLDGLSEPQPCTAARLGDVFHPVSAYQGKIKLCKGTQQRLKMWDADSYAPQARVQSSKH